jgi:hypothetical protein
MPDTVEVETPRTTEPDLPRATEPDLEVPEGGAPEPDDAAKQKPKSWVYLLIGGLLFASVAGPLVFYFLTWRYRPTALHHIPHGTTVAVRFDGPDLYLYAPFREHVLGAFEDAPGPDSYASRLKQRTGIDLRSDIREIILATATGKTFVLLVGGRFGKTRFDQETIPVALHTVLTEKGTSGFSLDGEVLVGPGGLRMAQAEDTTLVMTTDEEMLRAALEPSDAWQSLGLTPAGAMSFAVDEPALVALSRMAPGAAGDAFRKSKRVTGYVKLNKLKLEMEVIPSDGIGAEELSEAVTTSLAETELWTVLLPDTFGEKEALTSARSRPRVETVLVESNLPKEGVERGMKEVGDRIRRALAPVEEVQ